MRALIVVAGHLAAVFVAEYTDTGSGNLPPLTGTDQVVLEPTSLTHAVPGGAPLRERPRNGAASIADDRRCEASPGTGDGDVRATGQAASAQQPSLSDSKLPFRVRMSLLWTLAFLIAANAATITAMLLVRHRAGRQLLQGR